MGLELRDVAKRYGMQEVLHPLSLAVGSGEFLTLLGPSGSGKTTVLRLIGGFTEASSRIFAMVQSMKISANRRLVPPNAVSPALMPAIPWSVLWTTFLNSPIPNWSHR